MKKYFLLIMCILSIIVVNCNWNCNCNITPKKYSFVKDNNINASTRAIIENNNNLILQSILNNNPNIMHDLLFDKIKKSFSLIDVRNYYLQVNQIIKDYKFKKTNDYLITFNTKIDDETFIIYDFDPNKEIYVMKIKPFTKEAYLAFYESEGYVDDYLLTIQYGKDSKNNWKLITYHLGAYKLLGKNALEQFQYIQELYNNNYKISAVMRMNVLGKYITPSPFIQYKDEEKIKEFKNKIEDEVTKEYKFPVLVSEVNSKPEVYGMECTIVDKEIVPVIKYYSQIYNRPMATIQIEVDEITKYLEKYFPGITRDSKNVIYQIFSEPPIIQDKKYITKASYSKIKN